MRIARASPSPGTCSRCSRRPRVPVKRMVFHEITAAAIQPAIANPRDLDRRLVDAQEARRILDRLYGYEVSPVLWKKVMPRLSAGRVQSVATRIVVERERARMRFRTAAYWDLEGTFAKARQPATADASAPPSSPSTAPAWPRARTSTRPGSSARPATSLRPRRGRRPRALADRLAGRRLRRALGRARSPTGAARTPPFMTSTLQQEAGRKLRFSAAAHHARRPAPLRERLHHLHAHRQHRRCRRRR